MAAGAMIAQIALKAKQDYDKTGERAMSHIEKAYQQQTEERNSNNHWTGDDNSQARPQQQAPVVVNVKKDKDKDEDEKADEKAKESASTGDNAQEGNDGGIVEKLTGGAGGNSSGSGGSWIDEVFNMVNK